MFGGNILGSLLGLFYTMTALRLLKCQPVQHLLPFY